MPPFGLRALAPAPWLSLADETLSMWVFVRPYKRAQRSAESSQKLVRSLAAQAERRCAAPLKGQWQLLV
jgi:hypothetical protein